MSQLASSASPLWLHGSHLCMDLTIFACFLPRDKRVGEFPLSLARFLLKGRAYLAGIRARCHDLRRPVCFGIHHDGSDIPDSDPPCTLSRRCRTDTDRTDPASPTARSDQRRYVRGGRGLSLRRREPCFQSSSDLEMQPGVAAGPGELSWRMGGHYHDEKS